MTLLACCSVSLAERVSIRTDMSACQAFYLSVMHSYLRCRVDGQRSTGVMTPRWLGAGVPPARAPACAASDGFVRSYAPWLASPRSLSATSWLTWPTMCGGCSRTSSGRADGPRRPPASARPRSTCSRPTRPSRSWWTCRAWPPRRAGGAEGRTVVVVAGEKILGPPAGTGGGDFHLVERGFGRFARAVRVCGRRSTAAGRRARLVNGELRVVLPKHPRPAGPGPQGARSSRRPAERARLTGPIDEPPLHRRHRRAPRARSGARRAPRPRRAATASISSSPTPRTPRAASASRARSATSCSIAAWT